LEALITLIILARVIFWFKIAWEIENKRLEQLIHKIKKFIIFSKTEKTLIMDPVSVQTSFSIWLSKAQSCRVTVIVRSITSNVSHLRRPLAMSNTSLQIKIPRFSIKETIQEEIQSTQARVMVGEANTVVITSSQWHKILYQGLLLETQAMVVVWYSNQTMVSWLSLVMLHIKYHTEGTNTDQTIQTVLEIRWILKVTKEITPTLIRNHIKLQFIQEEIWYKIKTLLFLEIQRMLRYKTSRMIK